MSMDQNTVIDLLSSSDEESVDNERAEGSSQRLQVVFSSASQGLNLLAREAQNLCPKEGKEPVALAAAGDSDDDFASDASDDENDSWDHYELRSLEFSRNHCWACHVWIHHPGFDERQDEICFNALHLHPILGIPVCVVCAETIEAVERYQPPEKSNQEGPEGRTAEAMQDNMACSACGIPQDSEGEFISCDRCPRVVCPYCFQQSRHSSSGDEDNVLSFTEKLPRAMSVQRCFCCSCLEIDATIEKNSDFVNNENAKKNVGGELSSHHLPPFLEELRRLTQELFSYSKKEIQQTLDDALIELETLEAERHQCELNLDDPKDLREIVREELLEELGKEEEHVGGDERFEIHLENRFQECYEKWIHHQTRVMDRIALVNDRIKACYGVEAFAAFQYIKTNNEADTDDDNDKGEVSEPLWKVAADYELTRRDNEERAKRRKEQRLAQKSGNDPRYLLEITQDAEDLGSSDEDNGKSGDNSDEDHADSYDNGWRNTPVKAQKSEIDEALTEEDELRKKEGKTNLLRRHKTSDKEEIKAWDAGLKSSAMIIKKKTQKRKRLSTKLVSMPSGTNPSTAITASSCNDRPSVVVDKALGDVNINTLVGRSKGLRSSGFVLSENPLICVAENFDRHLKEHQREGIKFIYKNVFADLGDSNEAKIGGCVLAHSMGLGKSLSCVSLLYTMMMQPSLVNSETGTGKIHKALLVVPVNTIANWENEFDKWTKHIKKVNKLPIFNVSKFEKHSRETVIRYWSTAGGVLLSSKELFRSIAAREDTGKLISDTDVIILDESHTMLKNKQSKTYKAFMKIKTQRRICLTGTPFQNNLMEYYRMISYIRPNLLGYTENKFQRDFIDPIQAGVASDASDDQKASADDCLTKFVAMVEPYVQRKDASLLRKDLPSLQQVCLHLPPTKIQRAFYRAFRKYQERTNEKNFLKHFAALRTVHNHPATLLHRNEILRDSESKAQELTDKSCEEKKTSELAAIKIEPIEELSAIKTEPIDFDFASGKTEYRAADAIIEILSSDEEDGSDETDDASNEWWTGTAKKFGTDKMRHVESGYKCLVLMHLLAHASMLGEKTVVFSQSLKTLDFLTELLSSKDWQALCPSLKESFPGQSMGGWIMGKDFLRIDGGTSGEERGELLQDFSHDKSLKLFLISSVAGGVGINLVSASRVVLLDSHFNPTIDLQAIFRCYRYGQTRDVFVYRLLTQGTMEEKVYSRAMNKTSMGNRVIDGKKLHRCFEKDEIDSLTKVDDWVECTKCNKWRMFPPDHTEDINNIPDDWHCELMNKIDARMELTCKFEEKNSAWYYHHFKKPNQNLQTNSTTGTIETKRTGNLSLIESDKLVEKDKVLKNILTIRSSVDKSPLIVSKHYFLDTVLADVDAANDDEKASNSEIPRKKRKYETCKLTALV